MAECSIYQIVHTLDGVVYHLADHLKLLFEGYYEVFGSGVKLNQDAVQQTLDDLLERSRCPKGVSLFIRLEVDRAGVLTAREWERSLYCGYSLRCIAPRAAIIDFHIPHISFPTDMREAVVEYANGEAKRNGGEVALRQHGGFVDMINGAQIFGVTSAGLITAAESFSVEHKLLKELARQIEINVIERPIIASEIEKMDELFYVDHYGITAIRTCGMRSFLSIASSTLASKLAAITQG